MPLTTRYGFVDAPNADGTGWATLSAEMGNGDLTLTVTDPSLYPSAREFDINVGLRNVTTGAITNQQRMHVTGVSGSVFTVTRTDTSIVHAAGETVINDWTAEGVEHNPGAMTDAGDMQYLGSDGRMARLAAPADGSYVPVWASGVISWAASAIVATSVAANLILAGPAAGADAAPTFRSLVAADIPDISATYATPASVVSYVGGNYVPLTRTVNSKALSTDISLTASDVGAEVPLTFSTGLTRSTNTVTVNTSQNIATLSNLTGNGLVTTSGGVGTLGVTVPASGILTFLATPSSANLAAAVTGGTGSGALVFGTSPTLDGNITIPNTIHAAACGIIYKGASPFISDFNYGNNGTVTTQGNNLFFGNSGNLTTGSTATIATQSSMHVGIGDGALASITTAKENIAIGYLALNLNTIGDYNIAIGVHAGQRCTGSSNVIVGIDAMSGPSCTGGQNSAFGTDALQVNTGGFGNTAIGDHAQQANSNGFYNTSIGLSTLFANLTGNYNTALGPLALHDALGSNNVAVGHAAGSKETGSNAFYVNNIPQASLANDRAYSLLYGKFSGTAASLTGQSLTVNGNEYINGQVGIGLAATTALLHLGAGTATASTAPLKFTSGTNLTTAEAGAMEYNGTNLFFTRAGTVRENVLVAVDNASAPSTSVGVAITNYYGSAATNFLGDPNRWMSINILGTVYKVPLYS